MGPCQFAGARHLGLETEIDIQFARALLQQHEQLFARDSGKAMAGRYDLLAAIMNSDVVPISKVGADRIRAQGIVGNDVVECFFGEDDAPAERVIRPVTLEHGDIVGRIAQLHADREIKARRTATEARNLHAPPPILLEVRG